MTEAIESTAVEPTPPGLLAAMLAFQAEAPKLPKDGTNPHFKSKFTKLETIVEKVGPILNKHGLVWFAMPSRSKADGKPVLRYRLGHAPSGEALEDEMDLMLARGGAQEQGSGITYARRYALVSVLNLVADEDDDGHAASSSPSGAQPRMGSTPATGKQVGLVKRLFTQNGLNTREKCNLLRGAGVGLDPMNSEAEAEAAVETALKSLFKHQASALLDVLKDGPIPTGEPDIPADTDAFRQPPQREGDEWSQT